MNTDVVSCTVPAGYSCKIEAVWEPSDVLASLFLIACAILIIVGVAVWLDRHGR